MTSGPVLKQKFADKCSMIENKITNTGSHFPLRVSSTKAIVV